MPTRCWSLNSYLHAYLHFDFLSHVVEPGPWAKQSQQGRPVRRKGAMECEPGVSNLPLILFVVL